MEPKKASNPTKTPQRTPPVLKPPPVRVPRPAAAAPVLKVEIAADVEEVRCELQKLAEQCRELAAVCEETSRRLAATVPPTQPRRRQKEPPATVAGLPRDTTPDLCVFEILGEMPGEVVPGGAEPADSSRKTLSSVSSEAPTKTWKRPPPDFART